MADVFLSYNRADAAQAAVLDAWLVRQGLRTFLDRRDLGGGRLWVTDLERQIDHECAAIAVLVGPHGLGNTQLYEYQLAMTRQARQADFPVIPVILPGTEAHLWPRGFLGLQTWVSFADVTQIEASPAALQALVEAIRGRNSTTAAVQGVICPYKGLENFGEADSRIFFGRTDEAVALQRTVIEHRVAAVIGRSGSGKSSLALAGLLPALRNKPAAGWQTVWDRLVIRPGRAPLRSLAGALQPPAEGVGDIERLATLSRTATTLREASDDFVAELLHLQLERRRLAASRFLIVIDQAEELFSPPPDLRGQEEIRRFHADADQFIALLVQAAARAPASVVLTIRSDYFDPLMHSPFAPVLKDALVQLGRIADLRPCIEAPAALVRLRFDPPALVDRILDEVGRDESNLPLLQHALARTWQRREGARLTAAAYVASGGLAQAINQSAEDCFTYLTGEEQPAAKRLFLRLVRPGESGAHVRVRAPMPEDPVQRRVVAAFAQPERRLLFAGLHDGQPVVEVSHEALIRGWVRLLGWVEENRERLRTRDDVEGFRHSSPGTTLPEGVLLERAVALRNDPGDVDLVGLDTYIDASVAAATAGRERLTRERDRALLAESRALAVLARQATDAGDAMTGMLLALEALPRDATHPERPISGAAGMSLLDAWLRNRELQRLVGHRDKIDHAVFSGAGRYVVTRAFDGTARLWATDSARPEGQPLVCDGLLMRHATFSPDGSAIAALTEDGQAVLFLPSPTGMTGRVLAGHHRAVLHVAFSPDGCHVLTASSDRTARVWATSATEDRPMVLAGHSAAVHHVAVAADGKRLATISEDMVVRIWDKTGAMLYSADLGPDIRPGMEKKGLARGRFWSCSRIGWNAELTRFTAVTSEWWPSRSNHIQRWGFFPPEPVRRMPSIDLTEAHIVGCNAPLSGVLTRPPNWGTLGPASTSDRTMAIWDLAAADPVRTDVKFGPPNAAYPDNSFTHILSEDGTMAAAFAEWPGDQLITVEIIELRAAEPKRFALPPFARDVRYLAFDGAARRIVVVTNDTEASIWAARPDEAASTSLSGHTSWVVHTDIHPDGHLAVTASADSTIRLWRLDEGHSDSTALVGHTRAVTRVVFSPDGTRVLSGSEDATARIWSVADPSQPPVVLSGPMGSVRHAAFSADGRLIAVASEDNTVFLWDVSGEQPIRTLLQGHCAWLQHVAFSSDGRMLVTAADDYTIRVWDLNSVDAPPIVLAGHAACVRSVAFLPGGARILSASEDGTARIWSIADGLPSCVMLRGNTSEIKHAILSRDGTRVLAACGDHVARLWNLGDPDAHPLVLEGHQGGVAFADFSPDGTKAVTVSNDCTARVWDIGGASPSHVTLRGHCARVGHASFSPDGRHLLTAADDGTARLWFLPALPELLSSARGALTRGLTQAQRERYGLAVPEGLPFGRNVVPPPPTW